MVLLSPNQQRKVDEITEIQKTVSHVRTLIAELESNRAAKSTLVTNLCSTIARELSQMRQRLLTSPIGTVADVAGALAVMAARTGGINMKLRGLADGVNSMDMQLDQALKTAMAPEAKDKNQDKNKK
jgi:hypothetical protein